MQRFLPLLLPFLALTSGCGGDPALAGGEPPPSSRFVAGGIWVGSTSNGATIFGLVTETGKFHFLQGDGVQYLGHISATENAVSGIFVGVTRLGTAFPDGATTGSGTLSGVVEERDSFVGNATFQTRGVNTTHSTITLKYNDLYERDSSLDKIAGNYRDPDTNAIINVNSDGVVFSQDAASGCVINGTVKIIDPEFNAYKVQYRFSSCMGASARLNGTAAEGLGTLDNTVNPERAIIGVQNVRAGYAFIGVLPRT